MEKKSPPPLLPSAEQQKHLDLFLTLFPESIFCYIPEPTPSLDLKNPPRTFQSRLLDLSHQDRGFAAYISVNGFESSASPAPISRTADSCSLLQHLYVDIDAPKTPAFVSDKSLKSFKAQTLKTIQKLDSTIPLSALVETKRGFHVYWRILPDELSILPALSPKDNGQNTKRKEICSRYLALLKELRDRLSADHQASDIPRILRVPFSLHRKDPNTEPFVCSLLTLRPDQANTLEGYESLLLKKKENKEKEQEKDEKELDQLFSSLSSSNPSQERIESPESLEPFVNSVFRKAAPPSTEIPEDVRKTFFQEALEHVKKVFPILERPSFMSVASPRGIPEGQRNASLFCAASLMRKAGASEDQALAALGNYNNLPENEIRRTIRGAYKRPLLDFAWNHPILSPHVTSEEKAKVRSIVSDYCTNRLIEYIQIKRQQEKTIRSEQNKLDVITGDTSIPLLSRVEQQNILDRFPSAFLPIHPNLRYVSDGQFFLNLDPISNTWRVLDPKEMERLVMREIENLGLLRLTTVNTVKSQILRLSSTEAIQLPSSLLNSDHLLKQDFNSPGPFVPLSNGIFDLSTKTLLPYSPRAIYLSPIQTPYLPKEKINQKEFDTIERFIRAISCDDEERMRILQKIAGYTLLSDNRFQKSFFFLGEGSNGKSTFQNALATMLGMQNVLSFSFSELENRFFLASTMGKRLGLVEEITGNYFESDVFKRITGQSMISADRKNRDPISFVPFMKLVISVNQLPKVNDVFHGYYRRLSIVRFLNSFSPNQKDFDPEIEEKLKASRHAFLHFALTGLEILMAEKGFKETTDDAHALSEYAVSNSSFLSFLTRNYVSVPDTDKNVYKASGIPFHILFRHYSSFTQEQGQRGKSSPVLLDEVKRNKHPGFDSLSVEDLGATVTVFGLKNVSSPFSKL